MKLTTDPSTAAWLATRPRLQWDRGNRTKSLLKHEVSGDEIEEMLGLPFLFAGRIVEPDHAEARYLVLGQTEAGRRLALICTRRGDLLRPISCRPMREKERLLFAQEVWS